MLGDPHSDIGHLEHLPHRHRRQPSTAQIVTTPAATSRFMLDTLMRISDLPQRAPLVTRLPTGAPPGPGPQRLRRRLAEPIRRRRLRGVRRILTKPSPQVRVIRPQHRVLPAQVRVLLPQPRVLALKTTDPGVQPGKPLKQLHDGRRSGHPTIIHQERAGSNQPADEHLISHLENIANPDGAIVARISAVDEIAISAIGWAGPHFSCVTAGSARTETGVFGAVGLLIGAPTRAARDSAIPIISPERIADWASAEVAKVEERGLDRRQWWWVETFAEAMRVLGGRYESLPFWRVERDQLDEEELRSWLQSREDVVIVHPVHRLIRVGMVDQYADPLPGTVWFEDGSRPALSNATRRWPLPDSDETRNPGRLFEKAISEAWAVPMETVVAYRADLEALRVAVAMHGGESISGDAQHLIRSELAGTVIKPR